MEKRNVNGHIIHGPITLFKIGQSCIFWRLVIFNVVNINAKLTRYSFQTVKFYIARPWSFGYCFYVRLSWSPAVRVKRLPGIDEILGQADVSRGPCDGDLAL